MLFIPPVLNQEYCHIQSSIRIFSVHVNVPTHTGRRDRSQSHHVASFKTNINHQTLAVRLVILLLFYISVSRIYPVP